MSTSYGNYSFDPYSSGFNRKKSPWDNRYYQQDPFALTPAQVQGSTRYGAERQYGSGPNDNPWPIVPGDPPEYQKIRDRAYAEAIKFHDQNHQKIYNTAPVENVAPASATQYVPPRQSNYTAVGGGYTPPEGATAAASQNSQVASQVAASDLAAAPAAQQIGQVRGETPGGGVPYDYSGQLQTQTQSQTTDRTLPGFTPSTILPEAAKADLQPASPLSVAPVQIPSTTPTVSHDPAPVQIPVGTDTVSHSVVSDPAPTPSFAASWQRPGAGSSTPEMSYAAPWTRPAIATPAPYFDAYQQAIRDMYAQMVASGGGGRMTF